MAIARIALIGSNEFMRGTLYDLFRESNFEAELLDIGSDDLKLVDTKKYDLVVVRSDFSTSGGEEAFFDFLLSARGFLLVDDNRDPSPQCISPTMSMEQILSRVGNAIFRTETTTGLPPRTSPRIAVNLDVQYSFGDMNYKSVINNLSNNGAFIATLSPLPKDSRIDLSFSLPGGADCVRAVGRVLYSISFNLESGIISRNESGDRKVIAIPGMAVYFEEITAEHREAVRLYIEEKSF